MSDFVICYDISDPKRLCQVYRFLKQHAVALQYSVFLFTGDYRELDRIFAVVERYIDPNADDLRVYPLPARGLKVRLGKPALPEGIQFGGLPFAW